MLGEGVENLGVEGAEAGDALTFEVVGEPAEVDAGTGGSYECACRATHVGVEALGVPVAGNGVSLAEASTATMLREFGFDSTVDLVGAEPQLPYERPASCRTFLAGAGSSDDLLVKSTAEYDAAPSRAARAGLAE